jgi:ATP-dependent DNA helicase RecG
MVKLADATITSQGQISIPKKVRERLCLQTGCRVAFFDDRIEVESPGLLLPGVTVDDMKQGVSQIRNPVLARVFRELELVEQWGSGVPGIFAQAKAAGLPEPTIEEITGRVRFTVWLAEPLPLLAEQSRRSGVGDALPLGPGAQSGAQSLAQSVMILKLLQAQALSSNELQLQMGLQTKTGAFKRAIKDLLAAGQIEYTIPDKPNSRLQKYRLTPLGRAFRD